MVEEVVESTSTTSVKASLPGMTGRSTPKKMSDIIGDAELRIPLPIGEFARVLGGGVVPGSIVLVGGDPGIGKSTLLLQMSLEMTTPAAGEKHGLKVLYVSGEESERQIKMRALRLSRLAEGKEKLSAKICFC
jgi:DNA repair protein RadA/Sms